MTKKQKAEKHREIMGNLRSALNDFIDEYEGMDYKNPLEPLKLAAALRSEALKWDLREAEGARHSPLDYTIIAALQTLLTKEE